MCFQVMYDKNRDPMPMDVFNEGTKQERWEFEKWMPRDQLMETDVGL